MSAVLSLAHDDVWEWSAAIRAMAASQACGRKRVRFVEDGIADHEIEEPDTGLRSTQPT
jgi:hypothetical protein